MQRKKNQKSRKAKKQKSRKAKSKEKRREVTYIHPIVSILSVSVSLSLDWTRPPHRSIHRQSDREVLPSQCFSLSLSLSLSGNLSLDPSSASFDPSACACRRRRRAGGRKETAEEEEEEEAERRGEESGNHG